MEAGLGKREEKETEEMTKRENYFAICGTPLHSAVLIPTQARTEAQKKLETRQVSPGTQSMHNILATLQRHSS